MLGLAAPAAPALAAAGHPAGPAHHQIARRAFNPGDGWFLDTPSGGTAALAQGSGNQVVLTDTSGTRWDTTAATHGYKVMNANGLCWTKNGTALDLNTCTSGNGNQMFTFTGGPDGASITVFNGGETVGVFGTNSGRPVYVQNSAPFNTWVLAS
jgi:hypothetical protein